MDYQPAKFRTKAPDGLFAKRGFGFGLVMPYERQERIDAAQQIVLLLEGKDPTVGKKHLLELLSFAKGMFNRIARGDQKDWFTTSRMLGHPSHAYSDRVARNLALLRSAFKRRNKDRTVELLNVLKTEPLWECLDTYLGCTIRTDLRLPETGWAYVMWSGSERDVLAVGADEGSIEDVCARLGREYPGNPYGILGAWLVEDTSRASDVVRSIFDDHSLGDGFYRMEVGNTKRALQDALLRDGILVDSPWHEEAAKYRPAVPMLDDMSSDQPEAMPT